MKKLYFILIPIFSSVLFLYLITDNRKENKLDSDIVGKKILCSGKVQNSIYMYKGTGKILIGIEFFSSKVVKIRTMVYDGLKVKDKFPIIPVSETNLEGKYRINEFDIHINLKTYDDGTIRISRHGNLNRLNLELLHSGIVQTGIHQHEKYNQERLIPELIKCKLTKKNLKKWWEKKDNLETKKWEKIMSQRKI